MGIYLSTPSTEVNLEQGSGAGLEFAVGEMQGWRKNMEDAHISLPALVNDDSEPISLFGVFDGHGGKEVAKFTKLKYPDVLRSLPAFQERNFEQALRQSFHKIDELLEDPQYDSLLKELRAIPNPSDIAHQKAVKLSAPVVGRAKAQDESDGGAKDRALVTKETDAELRPLSQTDAIRLINEVLGGKTGGQAKDSGASQDKQSAGEDENADDKLCGATTPSTLIDESDKALCEDKPFDAKALQSEEKGASKESEKENEPCMALVVVPDQAEEKTQENKRQLAKRQREAAAKSEEVVKEKDEEHPHLPVERARTPVPEPSPAAPRPASIVNAQGQLVCNLLPHRILAGCTAIVGLVVGKTMYIANAGDSRGVLSRAGKALALSVDHKPRDAKEYARIESAGGFVNAVGRINGNLNLSRSLGDLKYKALKHLPVEAQIITAEPDIVSVGLQPEDEFFILGCDGIWDVLTNQQAVDFVRERLLRGESLEEITRAALKRCLAENPHQSQGMGGDNMTFLVVLLKPHATFSAQDQTVSDDRDVSEKDLEMLSLAGEDEKQLLHKKSYDEK